MLQFPSTPILFSTFSVASSIIIYIALSSSLQSGNICLIILSYIFRMAQLFYACTFFFQSNLARSTARSLSVQLALRVSSTECELEIFSDELSTGALRHSQHCHTDFKNAHTHHIKRQKRQILNYSQGSTITLSFRHQSLAQFFISFKFCHVAASIQASMQCARIGLYHETQWKVTLSRCV